VNDCFHVLSAHINRLLTCCALTVLGEDTVSHLNQEAAIEQKLTGQTIYTFIIYFFHLYKYTGTFHV